MNLFLLQATGANGGGYQMIIMLLLMVVIFYFFFIRPQQKRSKDLQRKRDAMSKGDKVVTSGGIYGTIREVRELDFLIEIAKDVHVYVDKNSVFATMSDADPKK